MMSQKLVLIDGHSILNRAFYGVPDLSNAEGLHTNAIYGFLNIMFKILEEEKPELPGSGIDVHAPTFRHQMYQAYKGTRKPMPEGIKTAGAGHEGSPEGHAYYHHGAGWIGSG